MKKKYISQSDVRVNNLQQFISDVYCKNHKNFYKDFKDLLLEKKYSEEGAERKQKQLRDALGKYKGKSFTEALEKIVEKIFDLPRGVLSDIRSERFPAYIFLSCTGVSANLIFSEVQKYEIVDEVVVLFGDIDVFVKVYASKEEIQNFITKDLYNIEGLNISSTNTYTSLEGKVWMRYSIQNHPDYMPPSDRWLKN